MIRPWLREFREFAMKGNVVDLAVGVIIGGAFGKIVTSLVGDVMMPVLGLIVGGVNFTEIKLHLKSAVAATATTPAIPAVTLNVGNFIQSVFDFLIVAFCIFLAMKAMNSFKREQAPAAAPPKQELLLGEIRDLLKDQSAAKS